MTVAEYLSRGFYQKQPPLVHRELWSMAATTSFFLLHLEGWVDMDIHDRCLRSPRSGCQQYDTHWISTSLSAAPCSPHMFLHSTKDDPKWIWSKVIRRHSLSSLIFLSVYTNTFGQMLNIKLMINFREISLHVCPDTNMSISGNDFNLPPMILFVVHAVLKSLPFHGIAAVYFSNLSNMKIDDFVSLLLNHCVRAIFRIMTRAITAPIPRKPQIFIPNLGKYRILLLLPRLVNYRK